MKTIFAICLLTLTASAAPIYLAPSNPPPVVSLAWDLAPSMSYQVYYGVGSRQYTNIVATGSTNFCTVSNLTRGVTYYFAATATDTNGLESLFSNEVTYSPKLPPAAPGNMLPPRTLIVQVKRSASDFMWADAGMDWTFDPTDTSSIFRLQIAAATPQISAQVRAARSAAITYPPMPGH